MSYFCAAAPLAVEPAVPQIAAVDLEAAGLNLEGDRAEVKAWLTALDAMPAAFNIAEP